jgi:hypothetical protein
LLTLPLGQEPAEAQPFGQEPAEAQPYYMESAQHWYVAPAGSDANDCRTASAPCQTVQGAVAKTPLGVHTLHLADGVYEGTAIDAVYYRVLTIRGNCADRGAVVLTRDTSGAIVSVQDGAIVTIRCLTLKSTTPNVSGIVGRQFAVADYRDVRFPVTGFLAAANEMSKANCVGTVEIHSGGAVYASAGGLSTISIGCPHYIAPGVSFIAFVTAGWKSLVMAQGATFEGNITGQKYILQDSTLVQPRGGLPGTIDGACYHGCAVGPPD